VAPHKRPILRETCGWRLAGKEVPFRRRQNIYRGEQFRVGIDANHLFKDFFTSNVICEPVVYERYAIGRVSEEPGVYLNYPRLVGAAIGQYHDSSFQDDEKIHSKRPL
jgi:hypothetical protein